MKNGDDSSQVIVGRATKFLFSILLFILVFVFLCYFSPFVFLFRLGSKCVAANCQCV
jgi:hypothetical protein